MGEAAGSGASGASIASLGLSAYSSVLKGQGTKAADEFQADRAERAAQFGRLQAGLTDTVMRERMNTTLSNIDVIRGAARIDPTSPTTAALKDRASLIADRQRTAAVLTQRSQAAEDDASANYLRQAGDFALSMGYFEAGTKVVDALGKMAAA